MAAITLDTVTLPGDLLWVDEFDWTPVEFSTRYTLDGALVIEQGTRQAGRPITLAGADDRGWITRQTLEALYALAQSPSAGMPLTLADGRTFTVVFRHDATPIEAAPVIPVSPAPTDLYYSVTIRLLEV